jgi:hypothetical protein
LKLFGCKTFALIPKESILKVNPCSIKCIFLGYSEKSKVYGLMDKSNGRIINFQDVISDESSIYDAQMHCPSSWKFKKKILFLTPIF